jgi:hypothetical protein
MTQIDIEDRLRFAFDNTWSVVKWDEEQSYLRGLLETQLMWLRPKVVVCKRNLGDSFSGLTVSSLHGAPT